MEKNHKNALKRSLEAIASKGKQVGTAVWRAAHRKTVWAVAVVLLILWGTAASRDSLPGAVQKTQRSKAANMSYSEEDLEEYEISEDYGVPMTGLMAAYEAESASGVRNEMQNDETAENAKIIRTASLTINTKRFAEDLEAIRNLCRTTGGWIASSKESANYNGLMTASLTLRIPSPKLDEFLSGTGKIGRTTVREESSEDVTESYRDTQTRLETQKKLMERLQTLVTDAADLSDVLELEEKIADTQYQIDRLQGQLQTTDRKVEYATVSLTLREEREAETATDERVTLFKRIHSALLLGINNLAGFASDVLVFLAMILPFAAVAAAAVLAVRLFRKRAKR